MFMNREKLYSAYHTVLSIALSWALALAVNQYYDLRVKIVLSAFFSIGPAVLIYLFDMNRKNMISYILLLSTIPIIALIFWGLRLNPLSWLSDLGNWCMTYDGSEELYVRHHANFLIFIVALVGIIIFYLLTKKQSAKIALAVILLATLIILSISEVNINKAVVAIIIFYILTIMVEIIGFINSKKAGREDKREGILYLAPVCLLLAILSITLPSKAEPIQWKGVKYIYNNIKEQIEVWKTDFNFYFGDGVSEFTVALTGYSDEDGTLTSENELIKDGKIALKVSGSQGNNPIYLVGSVSNIYTGNSWEKSKEDYLGEEKEYLLDYYELIYALSRQPVVTLENNRFLDWHTMKIEYRNIKTKTLFYPLKTTYYDILSKKVGVDTKFANITFSKLRGKGTTYENIFYEMNLQGDAFQQMLRNSEDFSYEDAPSINLEALDVVKINMITHDNIPAIIKRWDIYEVLQDRAEMINSQYTSLPDTLPDRVKDLALEITQNYDTKYDKLKAIENFLQGYQYSLDAVELPENADFVDQFLFENKKGYCTSYATSMAVLGRCIGIPTRFVEGFVAKFENKDENNLFPVKNSQAHAWCEAYFEGVGWIPFEATAPFYNVRYKKWRDLPQPSGVTAPDYSSRYMQENLQDKMGLNVGLTEVVPVKKDKTEDIITGVVAFLGIILVLIVFFIIYYFVLKYRYKKYFIIADYSGKMYLLFLRILRLLKREGYDLNQQETILMLAKRVKDMFHYNRVSFPEVASIYMRYRYADATITKEEFEQVEVFHKGLSDKRREEDNRMQIWLDEFLFLIRRGNR